MASGAKVPFRGKGNITVKKIPFRAKKIYTPEKRLPTLRRQVSSP